MTMAQWLEFILMALWAVGMTVAILWRGEWAMSLHLSRCPARTTDTSTTIRQAASLWRHTCPCCGRTIGRWGRTHDRPVDVELEA